MYLNGDEWPYLTLFLYGWVYDDAGEDPDVEEAARRFRFSVPIDESDHLLEEVRKVRERLDENWVSLGWTANRTFASREHADAWLADLESGLTAPVKAPIDGPTLL
ncbi:MAG TPA: hypothetical protein VMI31_15970 [Fimbriimonadaceae bacterium]|nr:hypothetical protein [Fimbriimonadaceae bacterium]